MTHGTTDVEQLNDGTLTRPALPPIPRQPRTPVKRKLIALTPYGREHDTGTDLPTR